jgi:hypothetical protein
MLLTKDVPKQYNVSAPLMSDTWLQKQASDDPSKKEDEYPIRLPIAGGKGQVHLSSVLLLRFSLTEKKQLTFIECGTGFNLIRTLLQQQQAFCRGHCIIPLKWGMRTVLSETIQLLILS